MGTEIQDVRLVLTINNKQPVELLDLTRSLVALSTNFDRYATTHGDTKENKAAKLYVKEVRSGSIIVELVEYATVGVIPFAENVNTILDFTNYFKEAVNYFLKGEGKDPELSPSEMREISAIVATTAKDKGSQLNICTTVNGDVTVNINLSYNDSNAIQNVVNTKLRKLKHPETTDDIEQKVVLTFFQARSDKTSKIGNKGTIESIDKKPMNIIFDTDGLKTEILHSDTNPLKTAYVVDARVETINDKPSIYRILQLHEYFDLDDND